MKALGMIETRGMVCAIESTDSMTKSADVKILGLKEIGGGLVSIYVQGEVGAVKAAIDAGAAAAKKVGELVSVQIISKPSVETIEILENFVGIKDE